MGGRRRFGRIELSQSNISLTKLQLPELKFKYNLQKILLDADNDSQ